MKTAIALMNNDPPFGSLRLPTFMWDREFRHGTRATRLASVVRWSRDLKAYGIECLVICDLSLRWYPHQMHALLTAFEAMHIALTAPIPTHDGRANLREYPVPKSKPRRGPQPLQLSEVAFIACDPAALALVDEHLPEATPADPFAPDWRLTELLGGVAPLRLGVSKPIRGHWATCTHETLARIPSLMGLLEPTLLAHVEGSEGSPETTHQPEEGPTG